MTRFGSTSMNVKKREGQNNIMRINKKVAAYILAAVCLLIAGAVLYYNVSDVTSLGFYNVGGQKASLEFISESDTDVGFSQEEKIYTENGITSVNFSGKITVDGTAEISIISEDGNVAYSDIYTNVKSKSTKFEVTDMSPYSYYTVKFSSTDAQTGSLTLTSDKVLVKQPEHPIHKHISMR